MSDTLKDTIKVLNNLIETSKDGEAGFRTCAKDVKDAQLQSLFSNRSRECAAAAGELQGLVLELGGKPEDSTSVGGDMHRRWVDLKALVTGKSDEAILNECERGEDVAKKHYSEALKETSLPVKVREVVQRQYNGVLRNHDQIKALRNIARAS
ncbi:PA2169 family four-helix-bundle protein [Pseudomonas sp. Gutcm_11s]|uniref:PA2169 family four-helix-bundle protein n=1 Tax=Pseudomonas sp. Gutcm_11s TaxID=3026088 RepID=UPI00235DE8FD|nr:PA2169 family four-helix-bundle protein [Pseudomonas sp. Gutcm_11s]MDD0843589.1 PA2169 family four-helix-bundle protein [Pseudomonas sp. Gutcm_11s]